MESPGGDETPRAHKHDSMMLTENFDPMKHRELKQEDSPREESVDTTPSDSDHETVLPPATSTSNVAFRPPIPATASWAYDVAHPSTGMLGDVREYLLTIPPTLKIAKDPPRWTLHFENIELRPEYRRQGLSLVLMDMVLQMLSLEENALVVMYIGSVWGRGEGRYRTADVECGGTERGCVSTKRGVRRRKRRS